jgi:hypothetical protein
MKALKTPLAKKVLADPRGKVQLRAYLETRSSSSNFEGTRPIASVQVRSKEGKIISVRPLIVPKAA